jgi:thiamine pyrophosphate-dependent acetolactate synthase large subunit-like protein
VAVDLPLDLGEPFMGWGSDAIAQTLRDVGLQYIALNPGSSYRGLHDSIVNYLGNDGPQMLLCVHEDQAVAIAHGYAKVTGRPMGVILHANVGLMHAIMSIYNAWCDRVPMIIMGGTTVDASARRPWIDWIHTSSDLGALVRNFVKFDNQPGSLTAAIEAIHRAKLLATTSPCGPTYVAFDVPLQESRIPAGWQLPDPTRLQPVLSADPSAASLKAAAELLRGATNPVILAGRVSRSEIAWKERVELAERLGARVLTDLKVGSAFPTDHPLHAAPPIFFMSPESIEVVRSADVVLSLNWIDLAGALKTSWKNEPIAAKIIHASNDLYVHNGWSMDHQALPPVDVGLLCDPDIATTALLQAIGDRPKSNIVDAGARPSDSFAPNDGPLTLIEVAQTLRKALAGDPVTMVRLPLGWPSDRWHFRGPLDFLGYDGGGGVGSGPGLAIGAAIGLQGTGRFVAAVIGDGEYMMSANALWTAAHYRVPVLILIANNHSFLNDELHQDRVARERGRPQRNRWIGMRIEDPIPDLAGLARDQGVTAFGPLIDRAELPKVLAEAVAVVKKGRPCVVDIHVASKYENTMGEAMVQMRPVASA